MRQEKRTPRLGMILVLCAAVAAIWLTAVYGTYKETQYTKYDVRVSPGSANYGTHSSVAMPMVSTAHRSTIPMVSGTAVRNYAHSGHASYAQTPSTVTPIYTTSSAKVQNIGSGSGGGGGTAASSGSRGASSRGMSYSGGSVSMPILSVNSSLLATSAVPAAEASAPRAGGPRRVHSDGAGGYEGDYNGEYYDGYGYWNAADEGWAENPFDGAIDIRADGTYEYQGTYPSGTWVKISDAPDPTNPTPLGATPWLWMLLLVVGYGVFKARKRSCL